MMARASLASCRQKGWRMLLLLLVLFMVPNCAPKIRSSSRKAVLLHSADASQGSNLKSKQRVRIGIEQMDRLLPLLRGKRVALFINHTSVVGPAQVSLLDTLITSGVNIKKVFVPEHGFRGDIDASKWVDDTVDKRTGTPIVSLYGKTKKPTEKHLSDVDLILFDMQDVGCRFYTYISSMHYAMQAAAEQGKEMIVCDRPNPNDYIAGPILEPDCHSFIGLDPLPILHGMTIGELAKMINGEGWLGLNADNRTKKNCRLTIIPVIGWQHGQPYSLPVAPSPNLPNDAAVRFYPSICFFEASIMSVGRGTNKPFQVIGYPNQSFGEFNFVPKAIKGRDSSPVLAGQVCYGLDLGAEPFDGGLSLDWLIRYHKIANENGLRLINRRRTFELIAGTKSLMSQLEDGLSADEIEASWQEGLEKFKTQRAKYLLYPDTQK